MLQLLSAVEVLETYGVRSEIWSATSYGELRREGLDCERENRLNPNSARQIPYVEQMLGDGAHPTIAVSDNQIAVPDMIRQWVGGDYTILGTDGFGRSDTRANLRRFFEIDAQHITLAALSSLVRSKEIKSEVYDKAIKELDISKERNDITAL
jgi:pyruvate dehydrogenase E1 component